MSIRRPSGRSALIAAAVIASLFALVAVVTVYRAQNSASEQFEAQDAATAVGSEAIPQMLGYRHETIAADLESATEVMTDGFAKKYTELAPQLVTTAEQRKIDVVATVRSVAALECGQECSTERVRLLAFVDQHRTIDGKAGSPAAMSVVLVMKKVDGDWLVDDLTTS